MRPDTQSFYERAVRRAVEQVTSQLDEALDLDALARGAALSPFHFHRVFRGMVGETPLELHRRLRMERAAYLLSDKGTSVTSVAFGAGYETHESFTRAFRSHYHCSPSDFRRGREPRPGCPRPFQTELPARSGIHYQPEPVGFSHLRLIRGGQDMQVEIEDMAELRVATMRHLGPYERISEAFGLLGARAGAAGLLGPGAVMLAIYHDDPETTPAGELRSDAALVVSEGARIPEGLGETRLPAGRYARYVHVGPYELLGDAWSRLMGEWLPSSGHRMGEGTTYEIYRNGPGEVPKDRLVTELYVPIGD